MGHPGKWLGVLELNRGMLGIELRLEVSCGGRLTQAPNSELCREELSPFLGIPQNLGLAGDSLGQVLVSRQWCCTSGQVSRK